RGWEGGAGGRGGMRRRGGRRHFGLGDRHRFTANVKIGSHNAQFRLDAGEPVAASETARGAGRRMSRNRIAVLAPQVAFLRNQPLSRLETADEAGPPGTPDRWSIV